MVNCIKESKYSKSSKFLKIQSRYIKEIEKV